MGKTVASLISLIRINNNLPYLICYESVVKIIMDVAHFFLTTLLFLVVIGFNMIFYYFILTYNELTSQQL